MKTKFKTENEIGITLVALIITIIILIILAAVTIKTLTHDGLVELAIKAAQDYKRAEGEELKELEKIDDMLKNVIDYGDESGKNNTPPRFIEEASGVAVSNSEIMINVIAVDDEDTKLYYTLSYGTSEEYGEILKAEGISGEEVTFNVKELGNYTDYHWKVEVSDGIVEAEEWKEGVTKTKCGLAGACAGGTPGFYCNTCAYSGGIYKKCGLTVSLSVTSGGGSSSCSNCGKTTYVFWRTAGKCANRALQRRRWLCLQ